MRHITHVRVLKDGGRFYGHKAVCKCGWIGEERTIFEDRLPFSSIRDAENDADDHVVAVTRGEQELE